MAVTLPKPVQAAQRPDRGKLGLRVMQIGLPILLILLWEFLYRVAGEMALSSPVETWNTLLDGFRRGWLVRGLHETAVALGGAYFFSVVLGIWLGVVLGVHSFSRQVFEPLVLTVYSIPKVTLYPVFLLFLGLGLPSKIAFGAFHGIFPVAIFTMNAVKTIRPAYLKVAAVMRCSRWQTFRNVVLPSVLPSLFTGLRTGFSLTFLGVILGEMFASRQGAGYLLVQAIGLHNVPRILAVAFLLIAFALLVNSAFLAVETRLRQRFGERENGSVSLAG